MWGILKKHNDNIFIILRTKGVYFQTYCVSKKEFILEGDSESKIKLEEVQGIQTKTEMEPKSIISASEAQTEAFETQNSVGQVGNVNLLRDMDFSWIRMMCSWIMSLVPIRKKC